MVWHILKYWVSFLLPAFYKRIQGKNLHNIKADGPVIIAMNHPNAFTDPILMTYLTSPLRLKYLARGDAFKPGVVSWLLEQIGIVPIFRIQDGGKEGLKKNDEAYRRVNYLLKRNSKIIVFAEGLCIQERRLRPLKKGIARMVFGAWEALDNDKLVVLPVGVNYSQPDKFRSTAFYNVGEPIPVKDFIAEYKENPARANNTLLQALEPKMKELITHIDNKENDEVVYMAEDLCKRQMLKSQGLSYKNLAHDYSVVKQITTRVNNAAIANQMLLDAFKVKARAYFTALRKNRLRDWIIDPSQNNEVSALFFSLRLFVMAITFPFYLIGITGNIAPLLLSDKLAKKIVKHKEFYSSFALALGMLLFLINYLLWFFISYAFSPNVFWPLGICAALALCGGFSLYYHVFMLRTFGIFRALRHKDIVKRFSLQREELLSLINKF